MVTTERKLLIGGEWVDGADGGYDVVNPATEDTVGVAPEASTAQALDAARAAQQIGAAIVVEPLSGAPQYPLRTAADVTAVLDRLPPDAAPAARLLAPSPSTPFSIRMTRPSPAWRRK